MKRQSHEYDLPPKIEKSGSNHQFRMTTGKSYQSRDGNKRPPTEIIIMPVIEPVGDKANVEVSTLTSIA